MFKLKLTSLVKRVSVILALIYMFGCGFLEETPDYQTPNDVLDFFPIESGDTWIYRYRLTDDIRPVLFEEEGEIELRVGSSSYSNGVWYHSIEDSRSGIRVALDSSRRDTLIRTFTYQIAEDGDNFIYLPFPELEEPLDPIPRYAKTSSNVLSHSTGPIEDGCLRRVDLVVDTGLDKIREFCYEGTELERYLTISRQYTP